MVRNLTGLLCCSAVAIVPSGQPRPAVLAARCDGRVALCVPWSRELFISDYLPVYMTLIAYPALQASQDASPMDSRVSVAWTCLSTVHGLCYICSILHASLPSRSVLDSLGTPIFRVTVSSPRHHKESLRGYADLLVTTTIKKHDPLCDDARTQMCNFRHKKRPCWCNAMTYHDASEPSPVGSSDFCGVYNDQCAAQWLRWYLFLRPHPSP